MRLMRFVLKSSVAGGVVYYSVQGGMWSSSEETADLYYRMYNGVAPYIQKNLPEHMTRVLPDLPSISILSNCARCTWNSGVMKSMKFVSELPTHMGNGVDWIMSVPMIRDTLSNLKGLPDVAPASGKPQ